MDLKDSITQSKIRKHEVSFEENIYSQFSSLNNMDKQLSDTYSFSWIELIENDDLRNAACNLSKDEKNCLIMCFTRKKLKVK